MQRWEYNTKKAMHIVWITNNWKNLANKNHLPVYLEGGTKMIRHKSFDPRANLEYESQNQGCVCPPQFPRPEYDTAFELGNKQHKLLVCIKWVKTKEILLLQQSILLGWVRFDQIYQLIIILINLDGTTAWRYIYKRKLVILQLCLQLYSRACPLFKNQFSI